MTAGLEDSIRPITITMPWDFAAELARFGPGRCDTPLSLTAARAYCRHVAQSHYENFVVASLLLPRRLVPHFHAVYAYCRWADDLADETDPGQALDLLAWWRAEFLAGYNGHSRHPVLVALRDTIRQFAIPPEPFLNLLVAFEQDQRVQEYATFADLLGYCRYSADPVGHLLLYLFRCWTPDRAVLADAICTGLQLANFWQDIHRDLDRGRVYLPADDRKRFGYSDADLRERRFTPGFAELMRFQVNRTHSYFDRGELLLARIPWEVRADVELFIAGGRAVLTAIERQGYDVWRGRPVVSHWAKLSMVGRAALSRWMG